MYGLIGFPLGHSFSRKYFTEKFRKEGIHDASFELFPLESIGQFAGLIESTPLLKGLSVTIPYKEQVIAYLDELDETAAAVGAVNSIRISRQGSKTILKGYNTDTWGFRSSLEGLGLEGSPRAMVLGTGGAAKAVCHVLEQKKWPFLQVSRQPRASGQIAYGQITTDLLASYRLLINTTPLGMFPKVDQCPELPYNALTKDHVLFDLVYNPAVTRFLQMGQMKGCIIKNGEEMLISQAERSWHLWNI